eukprot:1029359-Amorphochlora_amoeboformis.AAC.3
MSAPQPKTSMTIDTSSGSGNHEGPFATPSPSLLPSLMNAGNGTVGGPGQGSGGAMGSGVSAVSTVSNISPSVGVGVGVGVGLGRGMPGAGAMASISEDERIARMEVEMFRHLNRAETLRAEIRRAKQNQMALHQGHRITQTDPTPYRRLDPRVQGMYFGHQANGNHICRGKWRRLECMCIRCNYKYSNARREGRRDRYKGEQLVRMKADCPQ